MRDPQVQAERLELSIVSLDPREELGLDALSAPGAGAPARMARPSQIEGQPFR